jgi:hypothetical protein
MVFDLLDYPKTQLLVRQVLVLTEDYYDEENNYLFEPCFEYVRGLSCVIQSLLKE